VHESLAERVRDAKAGLFDRLLVFQNAASGRFQRCRGIHKLGPLACSSLSALASGTSDGWMSLIAATDLWGQSTGDNIMNNAFLDVGAPTGRASSNFRYRPGVATLRRVSCARRFQSPEADERAFDRTYRAGKWIDGFDKRF
jgi:hypothetical protein